MFALCTQVTLLAPVGPGVVERAADDPLAARDADRLDRDAGFAGRGFDPPVGRDLVDELDQLGGFLGLPFSNSMPAYRSSVFSRTITRSTGTLAEEAADALVLLARADAGEQPQGLPQVDVDAAKAGAHRRRDRGLQRALGAANALQHGVGQRRAEPFHHVDARFLHVPMDLDARGVDAAAGRRGQFGPGAVAGNQRNLVCHGGESLAACLGGKMAGLQATQAIRCPRERQTHPAQRAVRRGVVRLALL